MFYFDEVFYISVLVKLSEFYLSDSLRIRDKNNYTPRGKYYQLCSNDLSVDLAAPFVNLSSLGLLLKVKYRKIILSVICTLDVFEKRR